MIIIGKFMQKEHFKFFSVKLKSIRLLKNCGCWSKSISKINSTFKIERHVWLINERRTGHTLADHFAKTARTNNDLLMICLTDFVGPPVTCKKTTWSSVPINHSTFQWQLCNGNCGKLVQAIKKNLANN